MSFLYLVEAKHARWFCFVLPEGYLIDDRLKRDVRQRKSRRAEHEAAEEAKVDSARHLQQRIERTYGSKAA